LEDCVDELCLQGGMPVILYYADESEEFEFDGILSYQPTESPMWLAHPKLETYRLIRGMT